MTDHGPSAVPQEAQEARLLKLMEQWQDDALSLSAGQARSAEALPGEDDFQRGYRLGQRDRAENDAQALRSSSTARQEPNLPWRLGCMADAVLSAKVGPQARFFTRERVDEIVLLLREAEKRILEGR